MTPSSSSKLIDSHCHLHLLDLEEFHGDLDRVLALAQAEGVTHMLCVCTEPEEIPTLYDIAQRYSHINISVGVHPNTELSKEIYRDDLIAWASHHACIAIGETGLDYYRTQDEQEKEKQCIRFQEHIHAALSTSKPLIIHTRQAALDTIAIMKAEKADDIGGVMHCFTENWDVAKKALDLNFYISFSGIVTFKNAVELQEVAKKVPLDRILIETDSPFLAPAPFRGKQNHPALVKYVALALAELRQIPFDALAAQTCTNFYNCFRVQAS